IKEALKKVKTRGDVIIHVNLADFEFATERKKEFIQSVETVKNITLVEDTTVDKGGCIIETDFGSVDARIANQLGTLEQKILDISPLKTTVKKTSSKRKAKDNKPSLDDLIEDKNAEHFN
ncbi:MAG: FliH/SctL family protein, partial [Treponemataceae bacterium]